MAVCCRNNNKPKAMKEQICINLQHLISIGTDFQNIKWYCIFIHQLFAQVDYPNKDESGELRYCFHDFFLIYRLDLKVIFLFLLFIEI